MLSAEDASLDLCLKQWADETAGELRSVLLSASARIRALAAENEALRRENAYLTSIPEADRQAENVVAEYSKLHERTRVSESIAAELREKVERLRKALEWYGEQARLARLIHSGGDKGRHALAEDGGRRARSELEGQ